MSTVQLQHLLAFLGFGIAADGLWGPKTASAVVAFQQLAGLDPDGDPGPATQEALRQAVAYGLPGEAEPQGFWDTIRHFTRGEFGCKCGLYHAPYCDGFPEEPDERVVRIAEGIRGHFGQPAHIVSGLRCLRHNRDSGGVENSQHMDGTACDIRVEGVTAGQILGYLEGVEGVRYAYAINETNVHFDVPRR